MDDLLSLTLATRSGVKYPNGSFRSERHFLDFIINGKSLRELVGNPDMVSAFCFEYALDQTLNAAKRLLLSAPPDLPNDRRSLYLCSECGDLGCGAITALVARSGSTIVWKDFGHENTYEEEIHLDKYKSIGPFVFDASAYQQLIEYAADCLKAGPKV